MVIDPAMYADAGACRPGWGRRRGFTLVEVLVATTLGALLMVAMFMVLAGLGRERKALAQRAAGTVPLQLMELLRWDLVNARTVRSQGKGVLLSGFGCLDETTMSPRSLQPVDVLYEIQRLGGRSWLTRRQRCSVEPCDGPAELVCAGVTELTVTGPALPVNSPEKSSPTTRKNEDMRIDRQMRIHLDFDSPAKASIDDWVVLR